MAIIDFDTECWDDPFFQSLSPLGRYLFIYLWTNPHRNVAGFYIITLQTISNETRLSPDQVDSLLGEISPKVRYDRQKSVCWVIKHVRRQFLRPPRTISEQTRKGVRKAALKLYYHPFFEEFVDQYPEIFDPQEKHTPPILPMGGIDTPCIPPAYPLQGVQGGGGGGGGGSVLDVSSNINAESMVSLKHCAKPKKAVSPDVKKFIDHYFQTFQLKFAQPAIIQGAKDGANVKKLLSKIPFEQLTILLDRFFESDDPFIMNSGYTLGVFYTQIQKLMIGKRTGRGKTFEAGDLWEKIKEQEDERKRSAHLQIPHDEGKSSPSKPDKPHR